MHVKFLVHGTGDPGKAAAYLTGAHDHNGLERAEVRVLRGNPSLVGALAASLSAVHRYTSGVISWHVGDAPTEDEIDAVLHDFERLAFAGLEPDQYAWSAILHVDRDGARHVHVFAARVELRSGKAFNVAPPGWQKPFDALRDAWNHKCGWARPDDPLRARLVQPGSLALASRSVACRNQMAGNEASAMGVHPGDIRVALEVEPDQKQVITEWLMSGVHAGRINSRDDVLAAVSELGEINRISAEFVSVRLKPGAKPIRLKGLLFSEPFDGQALRQARNMPVIGNARETPNPEAANAARADLEAAIQRRATYNRSRYPCDSTAAAGSVEDAQAVKAQAAAIHAQQAREVVRSIRAGVEQASSEPEQKQEEPHDRAGNDAAAAANELVERVRAAVRSAGKALDRLREAALAAVRNDRRLVAVGRAFGSALEQLERAARQRSLNREVELDRFKRQINIVEVAQALGYKLDTPESSRACKVMTRDGDRIAVGTDEREDNGIYFSLNEKRDCGNVLDFAMKRMGGSLRRVRKELRRWIDVPKVPSPGRKPALERSARPEPIERDRFGLLVRWHRFAPYRLGHLTADCGLEEDMVSAWQVREDENGHACFRHIEEDEVCGWEEVGQGRTVIHGRRGLAFTRLDMEPVRQIVVAGSSVDVASWAQLRARPPGTAYASTGGAPDRRQVEMLIKHAQRSGARQIVLAIGPDGEGMATSIEQAVAGRFEVFTDRLPEPYRNWNDVLRASLANDRNQAPHRGVRARLRHH